MGGALGVSGVEIEGLVTDTLDLSRFPVFSEDAQIVVDDAYPVPVPDTAYFRGRIAGDPESIAVLAVPETGNPRGMLLNPAGVWMIEDQPIPSGKGLKARKLKSSELAARSTSVAVPMGWIWFPNPSHQTQAKALPSVRRKRQPPRRPIPPG